LFHEDFLNIDLFEKDKDEIFILDIKWLPSWIKIFAELKLLC